MTSTTTTRRWNPTEKHGGDQCLGQARSTCGRWRIERKLYMAGGGRDRYRWFVYLRVGPGPVECRDEILSNTFRTLTEAKRSVDA